MALGRVVDGLQMDQRTWGGEFLTDQIMTSLTAIAGNTNDPLTHSTADYLRII